MCDSELLVPFHGTYESTRIVYNAVVPGLAILIVLALCWTFVYRILRAVFATHQRISLDRLASTIVGTSTLIYYLCVCLLMNDAYRLATEQEMQYMQSRCAVRKIDSSIYREPLWPLKLFAPRYQTDLQLSVDNCLFDLSIAHENSDYIENLYAHRNDSIHPNNCSVLCWTTADVPTNVVLQMSNTQWSAGLALATLLVLPIAVGAFLSTCFGCALMSSYVRMLLSRRLNKRETEKYTQ